MANLCYSRQSNPYLHSENIFSFPSNSLFKAYLPNISLKKSCDSESLISPIPPFKLFSCLYVDILSALDRNPIHISLYPPESCPLTKAILIQSSLWQFGWIFWIYFSEFIWNLDHTWPYHSMCSYSLFCTLEHRSGKVGLKYIARLGFQLCPVLTLWLKQITQGLCMFPPVPALTS